MRLTALLALFLAFSSPVSAQSRSWPGAVGAGSQTLVPSSGVQPTICSVNSVGDEAGSSTNRTLRYCIDGAGSVGYNITTFFEAPGCVFTMGSAGLGGLDITNDSTVVLGGTCAAGAIHLRTLSHALSFAAAGFKVVDAKHVILADVYVWDQECVGGSACVNPEQKPFTFAADDNAYGIRLAVHGNSGDDAAAVCSPSLAPLGCEDITLESMLIGPVKKNPDAGGEGQCIPTGNNMVRLTVSKLFCAQSGHRAFILNCVACEFLNFLVTGQGGRSMEAYHTTTAWIAGSIWRTMYPRNAGNRAEVFRYRETVDTNGDGPAGRIRVGFSTTNAADTLLPSGDSLPVWQTAGSDFQDHAFNKGSRCANGSTFLRAGCPNGTDTTLALTRTKPFPDNINQPTVLSHTALWDTVVVDYQIGPHVLVACDGSVSSLNNLRPFTKTHLDRQAKGRIPNNENDWPILMSTWAEGGDNWPDTTSTGRGSCTDVSPADGIPDAFVSAIGPFLGDADGDGYENWREAFLSLTDPLTATDDAGEGGGGGGAPTPTLSGTINAYLDSLVTVYLYGSGVLADGTPADSFAVRYWQLAAAGVSGERCGGDASTGYRSVLLTNDTILSATPMDSLSLSDTLAAWSRRGRCASVDAIKSRTIPGEDFAWTWTSDAYDWLDAEIRGGGVVQRSKSISNTLARTSRRLVGLFQWE